MALYFAGDKQGDKSNKRVQVGRPKKCEGGWKSVNKRIQIGNETFAKWRNLRTELRLPNDDAVACYLLAAVEHLDSPRASPDYSVNGLGINQAERER